MNDRNILSKPHSVGILVFLLRSGGKSKATFIQEAIESNFDTMKNAAARLEDEGFLTITRVPGKASHILYALTDIGRDVAQYLDAAERVISGDLAECGKLSTNHGASSEQRDQVE